MLFEKNLYLLIYDVGYAQGYHNHENGQIIGALQDMDIEDLAIVEAPQQETFMDCDVKMMIYWVTS